jgi:hypothetical protein
MGNIFIRAGLILYFLFFSRTDKIIQRKITKTQVAGKIDSMCSIVKNLDFGRAG